jgi:hypothetical protein
MSRHVKRQRNALLALLIIVLVLLGLSILKQEFSCVAMKDVEPVITGNNVVPSATIVNVTMNNAVVTPINSLGTNVYLIPNGASYSIYVQAYSDGLGLGPWQVVKGTFTAPVCGCNIVKPDVQVYATMQATQL